MPHRKLDRYLGIRGWILLICAWVWSLIGLGVILNAARTGEASLLHLYMPVGFRVFLWWAAAALAVYGALRRKHLVIVIPALIIAPLIRVASYLWGWITWAAHDPVNGYAAGWYAASMHAPLIALVLIAAHVKEHTRDEVK